MQLVTFFRRLVQIAGVHHLASIRILFLSRKHQSEFRYRTRLRWRSRRSSLLPHMCCGSLRIWGHRRPEGEGILTQRVRPCLRGFGGVRFAMEFCTEMLCTRYHAESERRFPGRDMLALMASSPPCSLYGLYSRCTHQCPRIRG